MQEDLSITMMNENVLALYPVMQLLFYIDTVIKDQSFVQSDNDDIRHTSVSYNYQRIGQIIN